VAPSLVLVAPCRWRVGPTEVAFALIVTSLWLITASPASAAADAPSVSFKRDVAPILLKQCQTCHGPDKTKGTYRLDTFDRLGKAGSSGDPPIVAGRPDDSALYKLLVTHDADERMPQKSDPLPKEQVWAIRTWIAQGAKFDGPGPAAAIASYAQDAGAGAAAPAVYKRPVPITALAFAPDGSTLLANGFHELTRWNPTVGKLVGRTPLPVQRVQAIAVDATTGRVAVAGGTPGVNGELLLLDTDGKSVSRSLEKTADLMLSVRFSPDGKALAAGGSDGAVRVYDVASGKRLWKLEPHADWVTDLAFSPDGGLLVTASRDKSCRVFEVASAEAEASYQDHPEAVYAVAFAADGKTVFSAGRDRKLHMWSAVDGKAQSQTGGFGGDVLRLERTGTSLFSACEDGKLRTHATDQAAAPKPASNPATGSATRPADDKKKAEKPLPRLLVRKVDVSPDWVYSIAVSGPAGLVAAGAQDGTVGVWAIEDGKPVATFVAAPGKK
jgi:mono/diheme cytochrome c family protein